MTPLSHREEEVGSYLAFIYKLLPVNLLELQKTQKELSSTILELEYCYFLKVHAGSEEVAHAVGRVNRQIRGYKSVEMLLVSFRQTIFL